MIQNLARQPLAAALAALALATLSIRAQAQGCALSFSPSTTVTLGTDGTYEVQVGDVVLGMPTCAATLSVEVVRGLTGSGSPLVSCDDIGRRDLRAVVTDAVSGAQVSAMLTVGDELAPRLSVTDQTVACNAEITETLGISVADNCSSGSDLRLIVTDSPTPVTCGPDAQTILRFVVAVDAAGNRAGPVMQTITLQRVDLAAVDVPASRTVLTSETGVCPADVTLPIPVEEPTFDGRPLGDVCKLLFTTEDDTVQTCGGGFKLFREYKLLDCCTGAFRSAFQIIEYRDDVAPAFDAPPAVVQATGTSTREACEFVVAFSALTGLSDDCSSAAVRIVTPFGSVEANGGVLPTPVTLDDAPFTATYVVADACGNTSTADVTVTAEDNIPPVAQCEDVEVSLTSTAVTLVPAEAFDAGEGIGSAFVPESYDNCCAQSELTFAARRMDAPNAPFGPTIAVGCDDVGTRVAVILRVTDCNGQSNTCMVDAIVSDKLAPVVTPPDDLTLDCTAAIPTLPPPAVTGSPTIQANCGNVRVLTVRDDPTGLGACGSGVVVRTFVYGDDDGPIDSVTQTLTFVDPGVVTPPVLPEITRDCDELAGLTPPPLGTACQDFLVEGMNDIDYFLSPQGCTTKAIITYRYLSACPGVTDVIDVTQVVNLTDDQPATFSTAAGSLDTRVACVSELAAIGSPRPDVDGGCLGGGRAEVVSDVTTPTTTQTGCGNQVRVITYAPLSCTGVQGPDRFTVTITVDDDQAPTGTIVNADITLTCARDIPPMSTLVISGNADNCDAVGNRRFVEEIDNLTADSCSGTVTRVYQVFDACLNTRNLTQTFKVLDDEAPTLTVSLGTAGDLVECTSDITASATATDGCARTTEPTVNEVPTDVPLGGRPVDCGDIIRTIAFSATDACNNTSVPQEVTITVRDDSPPAVTFPSDPTLTVYVDLASVPAAFAQSELTIDDGCRDAALVDVQVSEQDVPTDPNQPACGGTLVRTYTATDACGNANVYTQELAYGGQAPTVTGPDPFTVGCYEDIPGIPADFAAVAADSFNVSGGAAPGLVVTGVATGPDRPAARDSCSYDILRVFELSDDCGRAFTISQTITVRDRDAPTLTVPSSVGPVQLNVDSCTRRLTFLATATDGCPPASSAGLTFTIDNDRGLTNLAAEPGRFTADFPSARTKLTFTVDDGCGNSSQDSLFVTLRDQSAPEPFCPTYRVTLGPGGTAIVTDADVETGIRGRIERAQSALACGSTIEFDVDPLEIVVDCDDFNAPGSLNYTIPSFSAGGVVELGCTGTIQVLEGPNDCSNPLGGGTLQGRVTAPLYGGGGVPDAVVELTVDGLVLATRTDARGHYRFDDAPTGDGLVRVQFNEDYRDRITTYDLLLMRRHLLGEDELANGHLLLAADVNDSESVTARDIRNTQRFIVGRDRELPAGRNAWTAAANLPLSATQQPWSHVSNAGVPVYVHDIDDPAPVDLEVVQLADLNPAPIFLGRSEVRFAAEDRYVVAGQTVTVSLLADRALDGYQLGFTAEGQLDLSYAGDFAEVASSQSGAKLKVSALGGGTDPARHIELSFISARAGMLSELVRLDGAFAAEAYQLGKRGAFPLQLGWLAPPVPATEVDLTVAPNPFGDALRVWTNLSAGAGPTGELTVRDVAGRELFATEVTEERSLTLATESWPEGVYTVTLVTPAARISRRVVLQR